MDETKPVIRDEIVIQAGETKALCRCWESKNFPFCDGSHRKIKTSKGPVIIRGKIDE